MGGQFEEMQNEIWKERKRRLDIVGYLPLGREAKVHIEVTAVIDARRSLRNHYKHKRANH